MNKTLVDKLVVITRDSDELVYSEGWEGIVVEENEETVDILTMFDDIEENGIITVYKSDIKEVF